MSGLARQLRMATRPTEAEERQLKQRVSAALLRACAGVLLPERAELTRVISTVESSVGARRYVQNVPKEGAIKRALSRSRWRRLVGCACLGGLVGTGALAEATSRRGLMSVPELGWLGGIWGSLSSGSSDSCALPETPSAQSPSRPDGASPPVMSAPAPDAPVKADTASRAGASGHGRTSDVPVDRSHPLYAKVVGTGPGATSGAGMPPELAQAPASGGAVGEPSPAAASGRPTLIPAPRRPRVEDRVGEPPVEAASGSLDPRVFGVEQLRVVGAQTAEHLVELVEQLQEADSSSQFAECPVTAPRLQEPAPLAVPPPLGFPPPSPLRPSERPERDKHAPAGSPATPSKGKPPASGRPSRGQKLAAADSPEPSPGGMPRPAPQRDAALAPSPSSGGGVPVPDMGGGESTSALPTSPTSPTSPVSPKAPESPASGSSPSSPDLMDVIWSPDGSGRAPALPDCDDEDGGIGG